MGTSLAEEACALRSIDCEGSSSGLPPLLANMDGHGVEVNSMVEVVIII